MSALGQSIIELPSDYSWDSRGGTTSTRQWVGLRGEIASYSAQLVALGVRHRVVNLPNGTHAELTANYGASTDGVSILQSPDEPLAVTWEMQGSEIDRPIWTAPLVRVEMDKMSNPDDRRAFRRRVEAYLREEEVVGGAGADAEMPINAANLVAWANTWSGGLITTGWVQQLLFIMMTGTETVPVSEYVLHREKIVASNTSIRLDYANKLHYWTSSELVADEDVPDFLLGGLPDGYWIKRTPTARQAGPGKWSLVQDWFYIDFLFGLLWPHKT